MNLGFIGFGEAAYELSSGLKQAGMEKIKAYDAQHEHSVYGELIKDRVKKAKVELLDSPEELLKFSNIIIVAVPANKTYEVHESIKKYLKKDTIYVDLTASNPSIKQKISESLEEKGVKFIDAAIMGPVVVYGHKVPILVSGKCSDTLKKYLNNFGMNITEVSKIPGNASAIKLIRSIYMKGISAILVEMLEAANRFEVEELVIHSIGETLDSKSFEETMNRLVTGTAIHAERRSKELDGTIEMLTTYNLNSTMSKAAKEKLETIAKTDIKENFKGKKPDSWIEVITSLTK
ncbi:prephenate dehydrogenase/arogenate dehydrogenase family protein [Oceanobacillus jeddahense]|uniref:prephenate dehydrogenase/arogenate dehydrogenase family protein n=1 Tax=Oceanobacillus jeddahense TaxID=1462527 RepID=UPI0005963957|nr:prephenate dehydrogenase/arogenate dehydrogenase family protein [Oceanobacillus jeddahense]